MRPCTLPCLALLLTAGLLAGCGRTQTAAVESPVAHAQDAPSAVAQGPRIAVTQAWVRAAPVASTAAVYLHITNSGSQDDQLLSASSPLAARTTLHRTAHHEGIARMRPLDELVIGHGQTVKAEPNGLHVMLEELSRPLVQGEHIPLELRFRDAGGVATQVEVLAIDALPGAAHEHHPDDPHAGH